MNYMSDVMGQPLTKRLAALPTLAKNAWRVSGQHGEVPVSWRVRWVSGQLFAVVKGS